MSTRVITSPLQHRISAQRDNERIVRVVTFAIFIAVPFCICYGLIVAHPLGGSALALGSGLIAFLLYERWQANRELRALALLHRDLSRVEYSAWWEDVKRCAAEQGYGVLFCSGDVHSNALHETFRAYYARRLSPDAAFKEWLIR